MKYSLALLLTAVLGLGALPSSARAETIVVSTHSDRDHHYGDYHRGDRREYHRRSHRQYRSAHWERRRGHRVWVPARTVVVYF